MAWGLDKTGMNIPNQFEIREELDNLSRERFGNDINLTDKSPNGIFNGIISEELGFIWMQSLLTYNSAHPSTASGVQLDYLAPFYNTLRRIAQNASVTLSFTGTPGHTETFAKQYQTLEGIVFVLSENVTFDNLGKGSGLAYAQVAGAQGNVPINTVTIQVEPDSDVLTVTNSDVGIGGVNAEDDEEFRKRLLDSGASLGSGTVNAIYADLQNIPGVRAVRIKVNVEDTVVDGMPPHSISVFALGGQGQDVANALMDNYTGNQFFGTESYQVVDVGGYFHAIAFSRPQVVEIQANVVLTTNANFNSNGINQVKDAIVQLIGGTNTSNSSDAGLNMGDDVIFTQVLNAVMNVPGVVDADVKIAKVGETLAAQTIDIDDNEVANINITNIAVS